MESPLVIFSDSDALIGDIEWIFRNKLEFVSTSSVDWLMEYLKLHNVKLLIADMDTNNVFRTEVLKNIREFSCNETAFLFLVSERGMLEFEEASYDISNPLVFADWLVKPFSRNTLISKVGKVCE